MTLKCLLGFHDWRYVCVSWGSRTGRPLNAFLHYENPENCPACIRRDCLKCHKWEIARRIGWRRP